MYLKRANELQFYCYIFIVLWSPVCFGPSRGHLQGDFFENKKRILIKIYLNHSTVLKFIQLWLKFAVVFQVVHYPHHTTPNTLDYNSPPVRAVYVPAHTINNFT